MTQRNDLQEFWRDAFAGRISRRDILRRGAALGLTAPVVAALAQESLRTGLAQDRDPIVTFYNWITDLHPAIMDISDEQGVRAEIAPTQNASFDRFVAEARNEESTWDMYVGITPFVEMTALAESGTIEPWDPYLPEGLLDDLIPATREEGTYNGSLYVWPFLLDVIVQGWNAGLVEAAGLDPEAAPANWDEFIANAQQVVDSGAAQFGLTFDYHDWRSLLPITHSIDTDVYTSDGLFMYTSDAAVEALEIMKRMMPLANPDVLSPGSTDGGINATPDEQAFAAEQAAYYVKYQNAHMRMAASWPDPSNVRVSALPVQEGGAGGTVFWSTGAGLLTYGSNKERVAEYMQAICNDTRIWENSIVGNPDQGTIPVGQIPVFQSIWNEWETSPPDWLTANPWASSIYHGLENAKAISPSILAITQFDVARPEWTKYLSGEVSDAREAMTMAWDAVAAEFERQVGRAPE